MLHTMFTKKAAEHFNVHPKTIQRWIRNGKLSADMIDGRWHVHIEEHSKEHNTPHEEYNAPHKEQHVPSDVQNLKAQLERADSEIQHLRHQLVSKDEQIESLTQEIDRLTQVVAMSQKNIAALTEQNQLLLEDKSHPWWKRIFRR